MIRLEYLSPALENDGERPTVPKHHIYSTISIGIVAMCLTAVILVVLIKAKPDDLPVIWERTCAAFENVMESGKTIIALLTVVSIALGMKLHYANKRNTILKGEIERVKKENKGLRIDLTREKRKNAR